MGLLTKLAKHMTHFIGPTAELTYPHQAPSSDHGGPSFDHGTPTTKHRAERFFQYNNKQINNRYVK